jgi:hypothetical protein
MRATTVVVTDVLREQRSRMPCTEDQHAVGEFGSGGQHEPLGEAVRPGAARRNLHHGYIHVGQDRIERGCEPARSIADEEPELGGTITEIQDEVAGGLGGPWSIRMRGHAADVHVATVHLEANSTYSRRSVSAQST